MNRLLLPSSLNFVNTRVNIFYQPRNQLSNLFRQRSCCALTIARRRHFPLTRRITGDSPVRIDGLDRRLTQVQTHGAAAINDHHGGGLGSLGRGDLEANTTSGNVFSGEILPGRYEPSIDRTRS
uniref:Uncharacterized protein n=1 Tax=Spongospora subterranea TaxID=70186 RepID=A0A0H5QFD5_9EUKA|eukprot:CRZ00758.1 hypothetical protein [Spongospora subterranea]